MGLIKGALIGIAVYAAVKHITKKDVLTGRSIFDDLKEKAPSYVDKVKDYVGQVQDEFMEPARPI